MFEKINFRKLLSENYPIIAILIGVALISLSIGPFQTLDTQLEFETTKSILINGWPYLPSTGQIINEPPLGFYTAALFFKAFGFSVESGTFLVTLFGLGCTFIVYKLGKEFYGKTTGLFAAAFFALAPWELVLSRAFLIDTQCLFLSLVCLYFGILAIRRDSGKLAVASGIFFAAALLTKLYAAFMLVPLLILFVYHRPKTPKRILSQLAAFSLPALYTNFLWYQLILKENLVDYIFQHNDFRDVNFQNVVPSYSFIPTFLVNYGVGFLFLSAAAFSLIIGLLFRKRFPKQLLIFDFVCLASLLTVLGVNMYLAVNLNLKAPYTSAIKFSYQALPFLSLTAASLATKSALMFNGAKCTLKSQRLLLVLVGVAGLFLLVTPLLANMNAAHQLSQDSFLFFQVRADQNVGYSFDASPTSQNSLLMALQYLGFTLVLSGLLWVGRRFVLDLFQPMKSSIEAKTIIHPRKESVTVD
jgi:4-amino-4-deoxy-L-arabinose transferase-like glycosyltransferase